MKQLTFDQLQYFVFNYTDCQYQATILLEPGWYSQELGRAHFRLQGSEHSSTTPLKVLLWTDIKASKTLLFVTDQDDKTLYQRELNYDLFELIDLQDRSRRDAKDREEGSDAGSFTYEAEESEDEDDSKPAAKKKE
jgi:hypothetical protein